MRAAATFAVFACVVLVVACTGTTKQAGGLELILESDVPTPATFDTVDLKLEQQASGGTWSSLLDRDYVIPTEMTLPTTFALKAGASAYQTVRITVTGLTGNPSAPVVQRVVETQVPTDSVGEVLVVLSSRCIGKVTCPIAGDSCQPDSGVCGATTLTTVRPYSPGDVADAGVPSTKGPVHDAGPSMMMMGDDATTGEGDGGSDAGPGGDGGCVESSLTCNGQQPQTCTGGQYQNTGSACVNSACVAGTCQGVCSPQAIQCMGNGVQTCDAMGAWGTAAACPAATPFCNPTGICGVCANGTTQCSAGGVQTCVAGAWLAPVACSGQACSNGVCTGTCAPNATECSGNSVQTCDGTGHWSATVTSCGAQACVMGACQGVCSPGDSRCSGGTETCSTAGAWSAAQPCGSHQTCTGGGSAGAATCACNTDPTCKASGATCAGGATLDGCSQDAQGCFYPSTSSACANGACFGSAGSAQCCTNACTSGSTRCGGLGVETCVAQGNGCTAWNSGTACASTHQSCTGSGTCTCNTDPNCTSASNVCQGTTLDTCAKDAQGCFYTASSAACGTNKTCQSGACICQAAFTACGSSCVNVENDKSNCGGCSKVCPTLSSPSSIACDNGTCLGQVGGAVTTGGFVAIDSQMTVYAVRAITPNAAGTFAGIDAVVSSTDASGTFSNVILALYSDSGGAPGTLLWDNQSNLASFANPASLTLDVDPSEGTLDGSFTGALTANTTYWVYIKQGNSDPADISVGVSTSPCIALNGWINYGPPTFAWAGNMFYTTGACPGDLALSLIETFP